MKNKTITVYHFTDIEELLHELKKKTNEKSLAKNKIMQHCKKNTISTIITMHEH